MAPHSTSRCRWLRIYRDESVDVFAFCAGQSFKHGVDHGIVKLEQQFEYRSLTGRG